ncbi:MAG: serine/threonine protein kinase, partial [Verrucomicrobiales bacterium]|nr:serine/threonine protein kinase [Verrucomicrobiales bacterium]
MNSLLTDDTTPPPEIAGHSPGTLLRTAIEAARTGGSATGTGPGNWEPPLPEELAELMDGYQITGIIGRGGMGAVYRAIQTSLDRQVAVKVLPPEVGADPEFEARFRREAKAMAKLNHPNIVQIYDFGLTRAGHHYFVMEYVDGTDLHQLIRSGRLDADGAVNAVSQICDALEYAHTEGYVHRDIKPANIFLNSKGMIKVGDFGLAKLIDGTTEVSLSEQMGLTLPGIAMGTPNYIAPEQLALGGVVDHRADIYSLGIMFYEMLTGEIPRGHVRPPSQKVKTLDVRIDGVVFKAMETDPADRYQTATALRTDVEGIRTTPPPKRNAAAPSSASRSEPQAGKKSPATLAAMIGVPVLGLVVGLGWFWGGEKDDASSPSESTRNIDKIAEIPKPPSQIPPAPPSANTAPSSENSQPPALTQPSQPDEPLTLEKFLAAEPIFRPDPSFPLSQNDLSLTAKEVQFFDDHGKAKHDHEFKVLDNARIQFAYSTSQSVTVTFAPDFRHLRRSDGEQPTYTLHYLRKPAALPIAALIKLREDFSAPGKLEVIGPAVDADFLRTAEGIDDFTQVVATFSRSGNSLSWCALRANGEVFWCHQDGPLAKDVALIRRCHNEGFYLLHPDGHVSTTGTGVISPPSADDRFIDVTGGIEHGIGLLADGTAKTWGTVYPEWKIPKGALENVVEIAGTRYGAMTVTADGLGHVWGRNGASKTLKGGPDDPIVRVVPGWTDPNVTVFMTRSGALRDLQGLDTELPSAALNIAYLGNRVLIQDSNRHWEMVGENATPIPGLHDFISGHTFAAKSNDRLAAALRIVPVGVKASVASTPALSTAPTSVPAGRLHVFGTVSEGSGKIVPAPQPDGSSDYIAIETGLSGWLAIRRDGTLEVNAVRNEDKLSFPIGEVDARGLSNRQAVLLENGSLRFWNATYADRIGETSNVRFFDSVFRNTTAVFRDGSLKVWNTAAEESAQERTFSAQDVGEVRSVCAGNFGVSLLRTDGSLLLLGLNTKPYQPHRSEHFIEVDDVTNGFLGLTNDGRILYWGDKQLPFHVPENLPRATALRTGPQIAAIRKEDGSWMAWATPEYEGASRSVVEKIATLKDVVDLSVSADKGNYALVAWIEPVEAQSRIAKENQPSEAQPLAADDPIAKIDAAFYDQFEPAVQRPHWEAVKRLDGFIEAALERERLTAVKAGDLNSVLAWKTAIERLKSGQGVPSEADLAAEKPPVKRPAKLLGFYQTYRAELAKLETARDAKLKPLLDARTQALQKLEVERTQAGDLDTALRAKAARETPINPNAPRPQSGTGLQPV